MPLLQDEMKKELRARLDKMVDNIDPALVPQAHGMLDVAERQLGVENGNNNSEGELHPLGGETIMLTHEQERAKREAQKILSEAGLEGELVNDVGLSARELQARLAKDHPGVDIRVRGKKQLADDEGFIAGFFGSRARAKVIAGNTFEFLMKGAIVVACIAGTFWIMRRYFGDQVQALPHQVTVE